jgi:hypothetical protein
MKKQMMRMKVSQKAHLSRKLGERAGMRMFIKEHGYLFSNTKKQMLNGQLTIRIKVGGKA